jgi:adenosylhomocysteine nucleosidase
LIQPLLFIASDRREAEPWVSRWDSPHPLTLPVHWTRAGKWRGRDVLAFANGVGAERAAAAIQAAQTVGNSFSAIVSIGTCGALDPSLAIADIIVATSVTDGKTTWPALDPHGPPARSCLVHSSPHIARTTEEKRKLRQSGAIIVEMEAAGIAREAQELDVPFYCIRAVSDLAEESFFIDFENFLMPDGRFNVPRLAMHAMAHPIKGLSELLRLQRRTAEAAKQLGGFLADCSF